MKVVFLEDVAGVANGGDVKEVKNGFARNYLIPKNLAVPATHNAMQQIQSIAQRAEEDRTRTLTDLRAVAESLDGTQINIEMRSGLNNRLYGSVTNAVLADELSKLTGREIDRRTIILAEPIRELGLFEVPLRLHQDVEVPLSVLVYAIGTDPETALAVARGETVETEEPSEEASDESESDESADEAVADSEDEAAEEADEEESEEEEAASDEVEAAAEDETAEDTAEESEGEEEAVEEDDAEEADADEAAEDSKEKES